MDFIGWRGCRGALRLKERLQGRASAPARFPQMIPGCRQISRKRLNRQGLPPGSPHMETGRMQDRVFSARKAAVPAPAAGKVRYGLPQTSSAKGPHFRTASSRNRRRASVWVNSGMPSPSSTGAI